MMNLVMTLKNLSGGSWFDWTGFHNFKLCFQETSCSSENDGIEPILSLGLPTENKHT
jgi:hypothetical protein